MSTITENLNTIKNSMDRMKTALNLPANTPLEEITTNIEQGGGSVKSNIYRVSSIEERDAITNMVEGDMCVVINSNISGITETTEFNTLLLPSVVHVEEPVTSEFYFMFRPVDDNYDGWLDLSGRMNSSYFSMDIMSDMGGEQIHYESTDGGYTYNKVNPTSDTITLDTNVKYESYEPWNDLISLFLFVGSIDFTGIFEYKNNAWSYANVGLSLTANEMFEPNKGYSNSGVVEGSLIRDEYRKFNIAISDEAPTKKEGLWIKLKENETYEYSYGSYLAFDTGDPSLTNVIETMDVNDATIIKADKRVGHVVIGNELYCFSINSTVSSAKLNFITGEVTPIADSPNKFVTKAVYAESENCIYLCNNATGTYLGLWRYSIASNTYTKLANPPGTGYDNPIHYDGARGRLLLNDGRGNLYAYNISNNAWSKVYTNTSSSDRVATAFIASNRCSKIEGDYFYGVIRESMGTCGVYKVNLTDFTGGASNTLLTSFNSEYLDKENNIVYGINSSKELVKQHIDFETGEMTTKTYPIGYYYTSYAYPIITIYNGELYLLLGTNKDITNKNIKKFSNPKEYNPHTINICIGEEGKLTNICTATEINIVGAIIPSRAYSNNKNSIDELYAAVNIGGNIYDWILVKKYTE